MLDAKYHRYCHNDTVFIPLKDNSWQNSGRKVSDIYCIILFKSNFHFISDIF